ncbi:MAG: erythromycin esterase family protein [bacterium]|nr:erythromycin esterase family protein [bacterium]
MLHSAARLLLALFVIAAFTTTSAVAANEDLNLGFETGAPGGTPRGWFAGGDGYEAALVSDNPHGGEQCLRLTAVSSPRAFGVATNGFPVADAAGHTVTFSGWIRTEGVSDGFAGLWWRVDGPDRKSLAFDNMQDRPVTGDTEWTQYTITLPVAPEAVNINFGCLLPGKGTAWFDDLTVELDGVPYAQEKTALFAANDEQVAWLAANAHPFATDNPVYDNSDLAFLGDMVGSAHLVSLGESTHGTAEFFRLKHRLVRCLAEEHGFTLFAIEASMPEAERLNRYVLTGEGDPAALVAGMYFWTWRTEEVLAMVRWMRQHNEQGGHIEFHGFDMQSPGLAMRTVQDLAQAHAPDLVADVAANYAELRGLARAAAAGGSGYAQLPERLRTDINALRPRLEERRAALAAAVGDSTAAWALHCARLVEQYVEMCGGDGSTRDRCMAENVDWLLDRAGPDARMALWAHNGHISRVGYGMGSAMGTHLSRRHGADVVSCGLLFGAGTYTAWQSKGDVGAFGTSPAAPGSVEWAFGRTGQPRLALDLRRAERGSPASGWVWEPADMRSIGAMAMDDAFSSGVPGDHYDVLFYVQDSTPSVLLDVEAPSSWAMWD